MTRLALVAAAVLIGCAQIAGAQLANAQVGAQSGMPSLSPTSPLGMGVNSPVGQTGILLGATELATPGVSPGAACGSVSSAVSATTAGPTTAGSSLFDGGGTTTTAPGSGAMTASDPSNCGAIGVGSAAPLASSMGPGSSVGPVGIPLGSTELGSGGLSPPSVALSPNAVGPLMSLTPLLTIPNSAPSPSVTMPASTTVCQTTGTGVPGAGGLVTPFGTPLSGRSLGMADAGCRSD